MECLSIRVKLQSHASFIPGPSTFCYNMYGASQAAEGPLKEYHICPCFPAHSFFKGRWHMSETEPRVWPHRPNRFVCWNAEGTTSNLVTRVYANCKQLCSFPAESLSNQLLEPSLRSSGLGSGAAPRRNLALPQAPPQEESVPRWSPCLSPGPSL